MRTIVFLGSNKSGSSREAIRAAERLGYFTVLMTDRPKFVEKRSQFPDVHQMLFTDLQHLDRIRGHLQMLLTQGKVIELIVSFIEPLVSTAAMLSEEFCQTRISTDAMRKMEDKNETRKWLRDSPYTPQYIVFDPAEERLEDVLLRDLPPFPAVVKSPRSTGSKDVLLVERAEHLEVCLQRLLGKYPDQPILIEEYVTGPQVLTEALVIEGKAHIVAYIEQEITKGQRFIVMGYALDEMPEEIKPSLTTAVQEIVEQLGMETGACHLELRRVEDGWKLIEINPRISGGAMNRMIEAAYGVNLVQETLRLYLGEEPVLDAKVRRSVFTQYVTVSEHGVLDKVTGRQKSRSMPGVYEVYIKPTRGMRLRVPKSMGHRYAYVIAYGETMDQARDTAKRAAAEITFHLVPV